MADFIVTEKSCTKCKELKPAGYFVPCRKVRSGLSSWCRACIGAANAENRRRHADDPEWCEKQRGYHRKYRQTAHGIEKRRAYTSTDAVKQKKREYDHTEVRRAYNRERNRRDRQLPRYDIYRERAKMAARSEQAKARTRNARFQRKFGITLAQYEEMAAAQGGVCAICGSVNANGWFLAIDHDHNSGAVRGLLCTPCNTGIGLLKDSPTVLRSAANYLLAHQEEEQAA